MTAAANLHVLPVWMWLLFTVILVGIITLVYSHGNWKTTLTAIGVSLLLALAVVGVYLWDAYLANHFIGQFDTLGIPFRKAGPGWTIILEAWPMWVVPTGLITLLLLGVGWIAGHSLYHHTPTITHQKEQTSGVGPVVTPVQNVAKKLETEALKRELAATKEKLLTAIEMAETQIDKNQNLEIKLAQVKDQQHENIAALHDRITALTLQIEAIELQNTELTSHSLQQAEEILRLQTKTDSSSSGDSPIIS